MSLEKGFSKVEITELAYFNFKKTGNKNVIHVFLINDDGTHPARAEMMANYCKDIDEDPDQIFLMKLTPEEVNLYLEFKSQKRKKFRWLSIDIDHNLVIPEKLFTLSFSEITYVCFNSKLIFPIRLFQFHELNVLHLYFKDEIELPTDWSPFKFLRELSLSGEDYNKVNFDFLKSLPALKQLAVIGNHINNPELLDLFFQKGIHKIWTNVNYFTPEGGYKKDKNGKIVFIHTREFPYEFAIALAKSSMEIEKRKALFFIVVNLEKLEEAKNLSPEIQNDLLGIEYPKLIEIISNG